MPCGSKSSADSQPRYSTNVAKADGTCIPGLDHTAPKMCPTSRRSYSARSIISGSMRTARNTAGIVAKTDAAAIAANGSMSMVASVART